MPGSGFWDGMARVVLQKSGSVAKAVERFENDCDLACVRICYPVRKRTKRGKLPRKQYDTEFVLGALPPMVQGEPVNACYFPGIGWQFEARGDPIHETIKQFRDYRGLWVFYKKQNILDVMAKVAAE